MRRRSRWIPLTLAALLLPSLAAGGAAAAETTDAAEVETAMRALIDLLDSSAYGDRVPWDEHVVLSWRLAAGRDPSGFELLFVGLLREEIGFRRSSVLSAALRGERRVPSIDRLSEFLDRVDPSDFRSTPESRSAADRLRRSAASSALAEIRSLMSQPMRSRATRETLAPTPPVAAGAVYQTYFGYMHAHSELSDGEGDADEAYAHARDVAGLDYFALTDHGEELMIWPWERKYDELMEAADDADQPGVFTALWGFEWSNPLLGHISVIGSNQFTDAFSDLSLADLFDWILDRPGVMARFNHPGRYDDINLEFRHLDLYEPILARMVGIETWNKGDGFGRFHYDCEWLFCDSTYIDQGNGNGWALGALGSQDNHSRDWGTRNDYRVAVLAEDLTRDAVLDAYKERRFYATEDKDLELDVRAAGFPMGSRLTGVPRELVVTACDGSGDEFVEVRLYRGGVELESRAVSGNCIDETLIDPGAVTPEYYYVIVRQADDNDGDGRNDEAISSPIWIQ